MSRRGSSSGRNSDEDNTNNTNGVSTATLAGLAAAGIGAVAGVLYWGLIRNKNTETDSTLQQPSLSNQYSRNQGRSRLSQNQDNRSQSSQSSCDASPNQSSEPGKSFASSLISTLLRSVTNMNGYPDKVASAPAPLYPVINNLNALLADIYVRFIQIQRDDFHKHYHVFDGVFQHLHQKMKDVDPYYRKYSSMAQFAGSHYDNLRIKSADEFDMDIVIGLCLNLKENLLNPAESDIVIQHQSPGFVQLKMGTQYKNLPMRDGDEWKINKTAYKWQDDSHYLLRSKFLDWFKSVVSRALDTFESLNDVPVIYINGIAYSIYRSESGPSMTLFIKNERRGFQLDVDLVPALKFPEERWPISKTYRHIPRECKKGFWMVVGKPNKSASSLDQTRSWRIALHYQERDLMYNCYNLKQALRLIKCLRDAQGMKKIASYYIKTLFLWEVVERKDKNFWRAPPAELFKLMVGRLHRALVNEKIPYFWNKNNNLIGNIDSTTLFSYATGLVPLLQILENPISDNYKSVAKYLLSREEYNEYNKRFLHYNC